MHHPQLHFPCRTTGLEWSGGDELAVLVSVWLHGTYQKSTENVKKLMKCKVENLQKSMNIYM
jgi:hypothetical protein